MQDRNLSWFTSIGFQTQNLSCTSNTSFKLIQTKRCSLEILKILSYIGKCSANPALSTSDNSHFLLQKID